jgi:hypothetical protein
MLLCVMTEGVAYAHTLGLSSGRYVAHGATVEVDLSFARREMLAQCEGLDHDHDEQISPSELARSPDCLHLDRTLVVQADGVACEPTPVDSSLTESDGVSMRVVYTCAPGARRVQVDAEFLAKFSTSHRHVARAEGEDTSDQALDSKNHAFEITPLVAPGTRTAAPEKPPASFFTLGVSHILGGADHLVFLFGLLLAPGGITRKAARSLLLAITAFSVGHSLSLAMAVSGVFSPGANLIEPLIAASIAWVGFENVFMSEVRRRWLVTLPFGFVHGFGFASALAGVLSTGIGMPLFTFNLGVEVGQLIAVLPMIALIGALEKYGLVTIPVRRVASGFVLAAGVVWCVMRILHP